MNLSPVKPPHQSKTMIWAVLHPVLYAVPGFKDLVTQYPEVVGLIEMIVLMALRYFTNTSIRG